MEEDESAQGEDAATFDSQSTLTSLCHALPSCRAVGSP